MNKAMPVPATLSSAAANVWRDTTPGLLPGADPAVIEAYCTQVARMRDAQSRIDTEGLIVGDAKGQPVPHPALAIEKAAAEQVRKLSDQLSRWRC